MTWRVGRTRSAWLAHPLVMARFRETAPFSTRAADARHGRVERVDMGKIQRSVMPKGGRRGSTGLKGKIHRSVSRPPVKKTISRDRSKDYHGVDKLELKIRALEEEEAAGWPGCNALIIKAKVKELKNARAKLAIKDQKQER